LRQSSPALRDASAAELRFDPHMTTAARVELTLDIDPISDPIAGALRSTGGDPIEFSGWLGFAAALEELLRAVRSPSPGEARSADGG
jgi:hypothetical protein